MIKLKAGRRGLPPADIKERPSTSEASSPSGEPNGSSEMNSTTEKSSSIPIDFQENQHYAKDQNRGSTTGLFE